MIDRTLAEELLRKSMVMFDDDLPETVKKVDAKDIHSIYPGGNNSNSEYNHDGPRFSDDVIGYSIKTKKGHVCYSILDFGKHERHGYRIAGKGFSGSVMNLTTWMEFRLKQFPQN